MNAVAKMALVLGVVAGTARGQERAAAAGWVGNLATTATVTVSHVDNASRTSFEPTRKDADTLEVGVGATHRQQLTPGWLLQMGADASWLDVREYNRADQVKVGPRLGLQHKFGLGPYAPVLLLDATLSYKSARLELDRGWSTEAGIHLGKRFLPTFQAGLSARWMEHNARSAVFDLNQRSIIAEATWDVSDAWSLSASVGRLSGDIVANAAWPVWAQAISGGFGPTVLNYYTARPWLVTELYGAGWVSYNVEADVDLWSVTASWTITERTSAEFRYSSAFVVNKIGVRYPTDSWGLSVSHRF